MTLMIRQGVTVADVDYGMVLLDENDGRYWTLNSTGATVLRILLADGTPERAVTVLSREYAVDEATAGRDVKELLAGLRSARLVVERT